MMKDLCHTKEEEGAVLVVTLLIMVVMALIGFKKVMTISNGSVRANFLGIGNFY